MGNSYCLCRQVLLTHVSPFRLARDVRMSGNSACLAEIPLRNASLKEENSDFILPCVRKGFQDAESVIRTFRQALYLDTGLTGWLCQLLTELTDIYLYTEVTVIFTPERDVIFNFSVRPFQK